MSLEALEEDRDFLGVFDVSAPLRTVVKKNGSRGCADPCSLPLSYLRIAYYLCWYSPAGNTRQPGTRGSHSSLLLSFRAVLSGFPEELGVLPAGRVAPNGLVDRVSGPRNIANSQSLEAACAEGAATAMGRTNNLVHRDPGHHRHAEGHDVEAHEPRELERAAPPLTRSKIGAVDGVGIGIIIGVVLGGDVGTVINKIVMMFVRGVDATLRSLTGQVGRLTV